MPKWAREDWTDDMLGVEVVAGRVTVKLLLSRVLGTGSEVVGEARLMTGAPSSTPLIAESLLGLCPVAGRGAEDIAAVPVERRKAEGVAAIPDVGWGVVDFLEIFWC